MPKRLIVLPPDTYTLTQEDGTDTTLAVLAKAAGSIVQASPIIGDNITITGSNETALAGFRAAEVQYIWEQSADGSTGWATISGATSASLDTSSGVTDDYYVRRGWRGPNDTTYAYTAAVAVATPAGPPSMSVAPGVTGAPIETMDLTADETDAWTYAGEPATVTGRAYRLVIGGAVRVGPQTAPTLTIPDATGGQGFALELQVTIAEGGGVQSAWTGILSGSVQDALEITATVDGEMTVNNANGVIEVSITAPAVYAGTYLADMDDLANGPVNLVPPAIVPDALLVAGEGLTARDGLWLYDPDGGLPVSTFAWQRDGTDISGATGTAYTLDGADEGADITLVETLTQTGIGARSSTSPSLTIPGTGPTPLFSDSFTAYGAGDDIPAVSGDWQFEEISGGAYFRSDGAGLATIGNSNTGAQGAVYSGATSDDQYAEATFAGMSGTPNAANFGISVRQSGNDRVQFLYIEQDGDLLLGASGPADGGASQRFAHALMPGDVLRLHAQGTTATAYLNDVPVMTYPLAVITTGKPGIRGYFQNTGGAHFSRFTCGDL